MTKTTPKNEESQIKRWPNFVQKKKKEEEEKK